MSNNDAAPLVAQLRTASAIRAVGKHVDPTTTPESANMTKPLDFSKPIQTRDGQTVRILCTDRKHPKYPIIGAITRTDGMEVAEYWTTDGCIYASSKNSSLDLIQAPQPRKHAELIKRWADDDSVRIKFKSAGTLWTESTDPTFGSIWDYEEILPGDPLY